MPSRTSHKSRLLFWAPLTIQCKIVLIQSAPGRWHAANIDNIPMNGVQIRMSQNLWDEWPSHQAFLKWGSSMLGARVDDWVCFSVVYYAGSSLPSNFRELQYAFVEQHYPGIRRLRDEFDNPITGHLQSAAGQLQSILTVRPPRELHRSSNALSSLRKVSSE